MMRNVVARMMVMTVVFIGLPCITGKIESEYNRNGIVIENTNEFVSIEDTTGNVWELVKPDTVYTVGDKVTMRMFNNHTDNIIEDDTIINVSIND